MSTQADATAFAIDAALLCHELHCEEIVVLDLRGLSGVTDFFVICTGTSDRQMRAVAERVIDLGAARGIRLFGRAGESVGEWILLDFVDVVLHVFDAPRRAYYDLELLWGDAPRIDLSFPAHAAGKSRSA